MYLKRIIFLILIFAVVMIGFYFKDDLLKQYQYLGWKSVDDFYEFKEMGLNNLISQVKKEVFAPSPLKIDGQSQPKIIFLQSKIIEETNFQRMQNGNLPALKENEKLNQAAMAKATDMFQNQYFDHISPSGVGPGDLVQSYGYQYIITGENLILGNFFSEKEIVQHWMNSPGHRENILNNRYTEIGVAIIKGNYKGETVWIGVQEFGYPLSACPEPSPVLKDQINYDQTRLDEMVMQIEQRKNQIENSSPSDAAYGQMIKDYNQMVKEYNNLAETVKNLILQYNEQVNTFNSCVSGK